MPITALQNSKIMIFVRCSQCTQSHSRCYPVTYNNIKKFEDLKGKKVDLVASVVRFGIKMSDFALPDGSEMAQALCDGKIDAMIYTIGQQPITEATNSCDVKLVSVKGVPIDKLTDNYSGQSEVCTRVTRMRRLRLAYNHRNLSKSR